MGPRRARRRGMVMGAAIASSRNKSAAQPTPAPVQPVNPQAQTSTDDMVAQLEKLADLKDKGILTQEEFDAKKKQLLGL